MKKCLIFLTLLFSLVAQAKANWNPYSMDHETFVHLDDEQQRTVIIKTMEYIVELESQTSRSYQVNSESQHHQKYVQLLKKLNDFLISSAYAANDPDLKQLAERFSGLLSDPSNKGKICLYGGYVSRMNKDGKTCTHPGLVTGSDPLSLKIKEAYLKGPGSNPCTNGGQITCNPAVFGYSTAKTTEPFCVKTGQSTKGNDAHNVAYECMRKSLSAPDRKERLNVVSDAMTKSPAAFKSVQESIFKTCACGTTDTYSKTYVDYMRPHRTCFSMMNTIRNIKNSACPIMDVVATADFATKWNEYFGDDKSFDDLDPQYSGLFDTKYNELIKNEAVQKICKDLGNQVQREPLCEVGACKAKADGKSWECAINKIGFKTTKQGSQTEIWEDGKPAKMSFDALQVGESLVDVEVGNGEKIQCKATIEDPNKDPPKCTLSIADDEKDPKKSVITVAYTGFKDSDKPEGAWDKGTPSADKSSVTIDKTDAAQTVTLSWKLGTAQAAPTKGGTPTEGTPAQSGTPAQADPATSCAVEVPALENTGDGEKPYKIDVTSQEPKNPTDPKIKVVSVVTKGEEKVEQLGDLKIKWTRVGYSGKKDDKGKDKKDKKSSRVGDLNEDGTPKTEDPKDKKDEKGKEEKDKKDDKSAERSHERIIGEFSVDEDRVEKEYQTCAVVVDAEGKEVSNEDCDKVIPLKKDKPNQQPQQNYGPLTPPPVFQTPTFNTRAIGVQ